MSLGGVAGSRFGNSVKSRALSLIRRGPREVLWVPETVRLGNFLYFWLQAHLRRAQGQETYVLGTVEQSRWLDAFPAGREFVLRRDKVRLTDRRTNGVFQSFGSDFDGQQLSTFIREVLLTSPVLVPEGMANPHVGGGVLVVNIRRGDYYTRRWRGEFGFDIDAYMRAVISDIERRGLQYSEIRVVSDGMDWCRARLGWLAGYTDRLTYVDRQPSNDSPSKGIQAAIRDFRELFASPNLVVTNSTFSYWGGYVNSVVNEGVGDIWAPRFHQRELVREGVYAAPQLDSAWHVIENIAGGWDS